MTPSPLPATPPAASPLAGVRGWALTLASAFFLFTAFVFPFRIDWFDNKTYLYFPVELFVFGLLLLVPGRLAPLLRALAAAVLALGVVLRVADIVAYQVFSRAFNPVFDAYLLGHGLGFLRSSFGSVGALLAAVLAVALVLLIGLLAHGVLRRYRAVLLLAPRRALLLLGGGLLLWCALALAEWPRASRYFAEQLLKHVDNTRASVVDLRDFRAHVNDDAWAAAPGDTLLGKLQGKDVLVVFIESYGRILVDGPDYSAPFRATLEQATQTLTGAGFAARSAFLTSPTVGGISWLAHGTALSGLWIDSQVRYDSLLLSERPTLLHMFQRAGWRTVGVMPAITMAWPEGAYFGYDQLYSAPQLDYRGLPFNYVTMPDQFTLARFQQWERAREGRAPVMAEIALVSSHAPWTPVPRLIDWASVGDGSIFAAGELGGCAGGGVAGPGAGDAAVPGVGGICGTDAGVLGAGVWRRESGAADSGRPSADAVRDGQYRESRCAGASGGAGPGGAGGGGALGVVAGHAAAGGGAGVEDGCGEGSGVGDVFELRPLEARGPGRQNTD